MSTTLDLDAEVLDISILLEEIDTSDLSIVEKATNVWKETYAYRRMSLYENKKGIDAIDHFKVLKTSLASSLISSDFVAKFDSIYGAGTDGIPFVDRLIRKWPIISKKIIDLANNYCKANKCIDANDETEFAVANYMNVNDVFSKNTVSGSEEYTNAQVSY
ncbi:uncharacterized protein LOC116416258 [Nasonia vitripennis]|uniref:Uncharacterized protein n=1 Tax=Nasonia vitripennis TaxID=7425 RepID=A0A7M7Q3T7_NASVI|nr:uncharacterized protein LOC116416258 [Nasonia vitripennis]